MESVSQIVCRMRRLWTTLVDAQRLTSVHLTTTFHKGSNTFLYQFPATAYHTTTSAMTPLAAHVVPIPVNKDNYAYLIIDRLTKIAACVDPFNPNAVLSCVEKHHVDLRYCLTTHYHYDHSGGNEELKKKVGDRVHFIGSAYEETPGITHPKKHGDVFYIGDLKCTVLHAKCHTRGHLLFYIVNDADESSSPVLITGDGEDMLKIVRLLESLDPKTRIYPGHEYSINNLRFAMSLESDNVCISEALEKAKTLLSQGNFPVGTELQDERRYNPFLRCDQLKFKLGIPDEKTCMEECRRRKNMFS